MRSYILHNTHLGENIVSNAVYIESKIDGKTYCKSNGQFNRHLKTVNMTVKEYYECFTTGFTPLCSCGKPLTFYPSKELYANSCGNTKCVGNSVSATKQSWTEEKRIADSAAKKAAAKLKTNEQKKEQYLKAKATFQSKYGVDWGSELTAQKEKSKSTKLARYGDEKFNNNTKASTTRVNMSVEQKNKMNENRRQTNLTRYGVGCVMALPEYRKKSATSNSIGRDYSLPSGTVVGVRGYEDTVLNKLLEVYTEDEIKFHNTRADTYELPIFTYVNVNQHTANYYPDFYIESENKIIEVKSKWWWDGNGHEKYHSRLENNKRKVSAVLKEGYNYELWLFDSKDSYTIINGTNI